VPDLLLARPTRARLHAQSESHVLEDRHPPEQGVVLEDEADAALPRVAAGGVLAVEEDRAGVGRLEPRDDPEEARLPAPGRPSSATSSRPNREVTSDRATNVPKDFVTWRTRCSRDSPSAPLARFEDGLEDDRQDREARQERGDGERGGEAVLVVEDLHLERERVRPPRMCRRRPRPPELSGRPRRREQDAVEEAQSAFGSATAGGSERNPRRERVRPPSSSVPSDCIVGISSRATYGKVTKRVARTMAGGAKRTCRPSASTAPAGGRPAERRTKSIPATTGETANGRSIREMRRFLPGSRTSRGPSRPPPRDGVHRNTTTTTSAVSSGRRVPSIRAGRTRKPS